MDIASIQDFITGKKTYFVALTSLIGVLIGWAHKDIGNQAAIDQAVGLILAMTIRHGVTTAAAAAEKPASASTDDGIKIILK
jgi:hypothetical protein